MTNRNPVTGQATDNSGNSFSRDDLARARYAVTPEVGGVVTGKKVFGDGAGDVHYFRFTVNAGDDITAAARLLAGGADTFMLSLDDYRVIKADTPITRIDMVAIGSATSGSPAAGTLIDEADSEADTAAAMVSYEFDSADDVRAVTIQSSLSYGANSAPETSANYATVAVVGVSHADE